MAPFFFGKVGAAAIAFVAVIIFTRLLGSADYGRYIIVLLSGTALYTFLFGWLQAATIRLHSQSDGEKALDTLSSVAVVSVVAFTLLAGVLIFFIPRSYVTMAAATACFAAALGIHEIACAGLRVRNAGRAFLATTLGRAALATGFGAVVVTTGVAGYGGAAFVAAAAALLTGGLTLISLRPRLSPGAIDPTIVAEGVRYGFPMAMMASMATLLPLSSQYLLAFLESTSDVGTYAAADQLTSRTISMLLFAMHGSAVATLYRSYDQESAARLDERLKIQFARLLLLAAPLLALLTFANDTVASILFDNEFAPEVAAHLPLLALAATLAGLQGTFFALSFSLTKRSLLQLSINAGILAFHVPVSGMLIASLGSIGASTGRLATSVVALAIVAAVARSVHRTTIAWPTLYKMGGAVAAGAPLLILSEQTSGFFQMAALLAGAATIVLVLLALDYPTIRSLGRSLLSRITFRAG